MAHYKLRNNVYYVSGALRGALCDEQTGNVYSINESACKIVEGKESDEVFWEYLAGLGLAEASNHANTTPKLPEPEEIELSFMWLEIISDDCNLSCKHCYSGSMPPVKRKKLSKQHDSQRAFIPLKVLSRPRMTFSQWRRMLEEGYALGCRQVQFIGGEPFLYQGESGETVLDLASIARNIGFDYIEIFTNGTLLTQGKVDRICALNLRIAISLYSSIPEVHDQVTGLNGSYFKTMAALNMLNVACVKTRVTSTVMKSNETSLPSRLSESYQNIVLQNPDPIRQTGRGQNVNLQPSLDQEIKYGYLLEPNFTTKQRTFSRNLGGNNCLAGKIAINEFGVVTPCVFSRTQAVANVFHTGSLKNAIKSTFLQTIWHQSKDKILVCKDCEYRYVCTDCRPLAESTSKGTTAYLTAPYPRCTYNPYTGEWAKGAWRMNKDNEPFYDTSIEPLIKRALNINT